MIFHSKAERNLLFPRSFCETYHLLYEKQTIPVCILSHEKFKNGKCDTIDVYVNHEWLKIKPQVKDYQYYSYILHPKRMKEYMQRVRVK